MKGCAQGLVLKQRQKATWKWPIRSPHSPFRLISFHSSRNLSLPMKGDRRLRDDRKQRLGRRLITAGVHAMLRRPLITMKTIEQRKSEGMKNTKQQACAS